MATTGILATTSIDLYIPKPEGTAASKYSASSRDAIIFTVDKENKVNSATSNIICNAELIVNKNNYNTNYSASLNFYLGFMSGANFGVPTGCNIKYSSSSVTLVDNNWPGSSITKNIWWPKNTTDGDPVSGLSTSKKLSVALSNLGSIPISIASDTKPTSKKIVKKKFTVWYSLYDVFSKKWLSGNLTVNVNLGFQGTMKEVNVVFDKGSGKSMSTGGYSSYRKYPGDSFSLKNYTAQKDSTTEAIQYTVSYNVDGKNAKKPANQKTSKGSKTITYAFAGWRSDYNDKLYAEGSTYTVPKVNSKLTAEFEIDNESVTETAKLTSENLSPKLTTSGYIFTGWQYKDSWLNAVNSNIELKAIWEPKSYDIKFDLNGGILNNDGRDESSKLKVPNPLVGIKYGNSWSAPESPIMSTSGAIITDADLKKWQLKKTGYKFIGWSCVKVDEYKQLPDNLKNSIVKPGESGGTIFYDYLAKKEGKDPTTITLYAQWEYIVNHVNFYYYPGPKGSKMLTVKTEYSKKKLTWYLPDDYPQDSLPKGKIINNWNDEDYSFLFWSRMGGGTESEKEAALKEWNDNEGVWESPDAVPKQFTNRSNPQIVLPDKLSESEWNGDTTEFYGFWVRSGKKIKINGKWVNVDTAYIKIEDKWKLVSKFWIYNNGEWLPELGLTESSESDQNN